MGKRWARDGSLGDSLCQRLIKNCRCSARTPYINKPMKYTIVTFVSVVLFIAAGCTGNSSSATEENKNVIPIAEKPVAPATDAMTECRTCDFDYTSYKGELSKAEIEGLLLALNDEYLAWATYDRINKDFNNPRPFSNIQKAEGRHIEELGVLFKAYAIELPPNKWKGDAPGFKSIAEACEAGIKGEIANRDLYTKLFNSTEREEIITVYKALQSASEENHLPAFERCIGRSRGGRQGMPRS